MVETMTVVEINCETNQVTERPYTSQELAQYEIDKQALEERESIERQELAAKAAAKASAEAKLAALGLTPEEIAALR